MTVAERVRACRDDILKIAEKHGAHDVRLFGSVARGDTRDDSDIDFLVEYSRGHGLLEHAALIRELEVLLASKVDVVSVNALKPGIRERVLREAVPL